MKSGELFHPLESSTKEEGRARFLRFLPKIEARLNPDSPGHLSTVEGLKLMHRITTYKSDVPWPEQLIPDVATKVVVTGNPAARTNNDMKSAANAVTTKMRVLERRARNERVKAGEHRRPFWRGTHAIRFASSIFGGKSTPVRFTLDLRRRGVFRTLGTRVDADGVNTKVPAAHIVEIFDRFDDGDGREPEFYLGQLDDIESIVQMLCDWRDRHISEARSLDDYLRVLVFFSIMGAKVIHPFFDGNGRAFEAQMIKDLRAIGYPVEKMPYLSESENLAQNALEGVSNEFLFHFLERNRIPLIPRSRLVDLERPDLCEHYTRLLSTAIRARLMSGMPNSGYLRQVIDAGVDALKMSLSRDVGEHRKKGQTWGPQPDNPFYVKPGYYENEIVALKEVIAKRGEPTRTRS